MVSNSSAERLANPNSAFVTGRVNFCLDEITGHESSVTPRIFFSAFFGLVPWRRGQVIYLDHSQQLGTEPYIKTVAEYNIQHLLYSTAPKLPYFSCCVTK